MKIIEKIANKSKNLMNGDIPTIAFLGDSVTQGCFEVYMPEDNNVETVYDAENAYHHQVAKIFSMLYPNTPINIINAGISGDNARHGYERLKKDVLRFSPDLVVVSFGLNDATNGQDEGIEAYKTALKNIFTDVKNAGSEVIFLTENMMNTYIFYGMKDKFIKDIAQQTMDTENSGMLKKYFEAAKVTAKECGVAVCDVYSKWRTLAKNGVDTTALLSNDINHPAREMNWLFAYSLVETMMTN